MRFAVYFPLLVAMLFCCLAALGQPIQATRKGPLLSPAVPTDEQALRFGFIGCNRLPVSDAQTQPGAFPNFTANLGQLAQTARHLSGLNAQMLFLGGDFVMNAAADDVTLALQLEAWSLGWSAIGVDLPLYFTPGNHEMVYRDGEKQLPNPSCGPNYRAWLAAHPEYNAGITPGPTSESTYQDFETDALADDQSQMSYVLDVPTPQLRDPRFPLARAFRLVTLNSDTLTTLPADDPPFYGTGRAPAAWLASVIAEAQADPLIGGIIVMAHRPLSRIGGEEMEMASPYDERVYSALSSAVHSAQNPTGKVRAYLCAHAHMHDVSQLVGPPEAFEQRNSTSGEQLGLYQIVAGCCGSPLEKRWADHPTWGPGLPHLGIPFTNAAGQVEQQPYFGFQYVTVAVDGTTEIFNFGRPINPPYSRETYLQGPVPPATALSSVVVYP